MRLLWEGRAAGLVILDEAVWGEVEDLDPARVMAVSFRLRMGRKSFWGVGRGRSLFQVLEEAGFMVDCGVVGGVAKRRKPTEIDIETTYKRRRNDIEPTWDRRLDAV